MELTVGNGVNMAHEKLSDSGDSLSSESMWKFESSSPNHLRCDRDQDVTCGMVDNLALFLCVVFNLQGKNSNFSTRLLYPIWRKLLHHKTLHKTVILTFQINYACVVFWSILINRSQFHLQNSLDVFYIIYKSDYYFELFS